MEEGLRGNRVGLHQSACLGFDGAVHRPTKKVVKIGPNLGLNDMGLGSNKTMIKNKRIKTKNNKNK